MGLDVNTPKGQEYLSHQHDTMKRFCDNYRKFNLKHAETGSEDAAIDFVVTDLSKVVAIAEIKAREMTLDQLRRFGSYLVTYEKIRKGIDTADALGVSFLLIIKLIPDDIIVYFKLNEDVDIEVRETETQATCNGGVAVRKNAYISLDRMIEL